MFDLPGWLRGNVPDNEPEEPGYYEIELSPKLWMRLLDLLRGGKVHASTVKLIETQVMCARHVDLPLKVAGLDWAELEAEAKRQGVSPADILFDRAGHKSK